MGRSNGRYTAEFKAEIVSLVVRAGRPVSEVSRKHKVPTSSIYAWVRQARIDGGDGPEGGLTTAERSELSALRKKLREVTRERDFLARAAAFFASPSKKGSPS